MEILGQPSGILSPQPKLSHRFLSGLLVGPQAAGHDELLQPVGLHVGGEREALGEQARDGGLSGAGNAGDEIRGERRQEASSVGKGKREQRSGAHGSQDNGQRILGLCEHVFALYAELHSHSAFSFLDGASLPDELAVAAAELGYEALALTDHNSVCGSMEFAQAAAAAGLRAIHGAEVDLDDGRHLLLLVEDERGWSHLCRLLTAAHSRTRDGRPGAPPSDPVVGLETVLDHAAGLVCLTGCAARGVEDEPTARRLLDAFGSSARSCATTARATAAGPPSPAGSACPAWPPATSTRTPALGRRCRTR
jgi:hypothetical protein